MQGHMTIKGNHSKDKITAAKLAELTGKHKSSIIRRAKKEGWQNEKFKNKVLYKIDSLPEDIKATINKQHAETDIQHQSVSPAQNIDEREQRIIEELEKRSVILMGKHGIGKSYTIKKVIQNLTDKKVIFFTEPPTAKTILLNLKMATGVQAEDTKQDMVEALRGYRGSTVILAIDGIENLTPSAIEVLGFLMEQTWFRFLGAGHLGRKKKYNHVWLKAKGIFLKPLTRAQSKNLVQEVWSEADKHSLRIIVDKARGNPREIIRLATEARQGILPEDDERFFDFTPVILIIATIGLAIRVIGYGYQSAESYIIGGIIAAVFWGIFWIYRGYVAGWWGSKAR